MSSNDKDLIENNDLMLLHAWFENGKDFEVIKSEVQYPIMKVKTREDLWTKVIDVLEHNLHQQSNRLAVEVSDSSFEEKSKEWWLALLAIMNDAPIEELEKYSAGTHQMPEGVSKDCISVAARIISGYAANKKKSGIMQVRTSQENRLKELENAAEEKRNKLVEAENNLRRHKI